MTKGSKKKSKLTGGLSETQDDTELLKNLQTDLKRAYSLSNNPRVNKVMEFILDKLDKRLSENLSKVEFIEDKLSIDNDEQSTDEDPVLL